MTTESLPNPPVPPDCDLRKYNRMPLDVVRLRGSDIHVECTAEEKWFALELWMASFHQVPASSLPDEDAKLAYLAGLGRDKRTWNRVKKAALRGFSKHSDGRLYHPVMADICLSTWETMRSRKRGASITNNKRTDRQPIDNAQNQPRSTQRSIYSERTLTETPSERSKGRSAVATEGKDIPSPISPSLAAAGSGSLQAPPDRPSDRPKPTSTEDHGVEDIHGRVCVHYPKPVPSGKPDRLLWIDLSGVMDEVTLKRDLPELLLPPDQVLALRARAITERNAAKPPDPGGPQP